MNWNDTVMSSWQNEPKGTEWTEADAHGHAHTHKRSQQFEQKQLAAWECQCGTFLMAMPCMPSSPTCYTPCWVSNERKCRQNVPADSGLSYQRTEEHSALLPTHRLSRSRGITADIAESIRVRFLYFNRLNRLRKKKTMRRFYYKFHWGFDSSWWGFDLSLKNWPAGICFLQRLYKRVMVKTLPSTALLHHLQGHWCWHELTKIAPVSQDLHESKPPSRIMCLRSCPLSCV